MTPSYVGLSRVNLGAGIRDAAEPGLLWGVNAGELVAVSVEGPGSNDGKPPEALSAFPGSGLSMLCFFWRIFCTFSRVIRGEPRLVGLALALWMSVELPTRGMLRLKGDSARANGEQLREEGRLKGEALKGELFAVGEVERARFVGVETRPGRLSRLWLP